MPNVLTNLTKDCRKGVKYLEMCQLKENSSSNYGDCKTATKIQEERDLLSGNRDLARQSGKLTIHQYRANYCTNSALVTLRKHLQTSKDHVDKQQKHHVGVEKTSVAKQ